jgi:hypothetical protein
MKVDEVPQDDIKAYRGQTKLFYAVDESGHYQGVKSTGWDVERFATKLAVDELQLQTDEALIKARNKQVSPLAYHMARLRFDLTTMSQTTGFFQWQIKRHLTPEIFNKLSLKKLNRYTDVMKITVEELQSLPKEQASDQMVSEQEQK